MKKRLLLVQPPDFFIHPRYPALGLAYLGALAEALGWQVRLACASSLHPRKANLQIRKQAQDFDPDIIGISLLTFSAKQTYQLIDLLAAPSRTIIAGGPHATLLPEETLTQSRADIVVRGEAEATFSHLLQEYEKGRPLLEGINGISFRTAQGIRHNPDRPLLSEEELDRLPLPAKHLFTGKIFHPGNFGNICASRGCPYECTFCSKAVFKNTHRRRSVGSIIKEIKHLRRSFGLTYFYFVDDIFSLRRDWVEELCAALAEEQMDITWSCFCRIDSVDEEILRKMKAAGCLYIIYGAESLNTDSLDKIQKKITAEQTRKVLAMTHAAGIGVFLALIWGFPWETAQDAQALLDFLKEAYPLTYFIDLNRIVVFPGTSLYQNYSAGYGFQDWWLQNRPDSRMHLYQHLRSYYPYAKRPFFSADALTLEKMEQAYALADKRLLLTTAMIKNRNGRYIVLDPQKVQAALLFKFRSLVKLSFIRASIALSRKAPLVELNLLIPLYKLTEWLWRKINSVGRLLPGGKKKK